MFFIKITEPHESFFLAPLQELKEDFQLTLNVKMVISDSQRYP